MPHEKTYGGYTLAELAREPRFQHGFDRDIEPRDDVYDFKKQRRAAIKAFPDLVAAVKELEANCDGLEAKIVAAKIYLDSTPPDVLRALDVLDPGDEEE